MTDQSGPSAEAMEAAEFHCNKPGFMHSDMRERGEECHRCHQFARALDAFAAKRTEEMRGQYVSQETIEATGKLYLDVSEERDALAKRVRELEGEVEKQRAAGNGVTELYFDTKARAEKAEAALASQKPLVKAARQLKTQTLQGDCSLCGTGLSRGKSNPACAMCYVHIAREALGEDK